ncbi:outer membrane lipoprotein-sorting protein [Rubrivivax gelatinosus]|uniref:outer membrane lipoprotein-sorting protein n=1 Tax=Rubrivivax gelatinosus TaxID=28068 RepID=UPI001907C629|nr:outer membrane lipoprotein-sorting protein [Rubrivivax gelatinosus]MBK1615264.1 outer membrane lipoprotein-sorting protein [Rubrivivax gelatinosus]
MSENRLLPPTRRRLLAGLVSTTLAALGTAVRAEPDPALWLHDSDRIRNPPGSFSVRLQLTEFRQRQPVAASTLVVYARPADDGGEYRNLVRFVAPARDHGKLMLRNGQDLWFYDPASRASVRLSPQQRLLGQASNGDVMTTQLARDYDARWAGDERIRDGDGREVAAHRLVLAARRAGIAYPGVDYWLAVDDHRPLMARYHSAEGRLLKSAWFRRWQPVLGEVRPTETVIIDGLDPGWVTVMQLSEHTLREVPAAWLQRDFLPRWKDER